MKILFLIRSLDFGGAERQLVALAKGLHYRGQSVSLAVFYGGGNLQSELAEAKVPIGLLKKRGRWDVVPFLWRLIQLTRREQPVILHSYLTVANLVATLIKPLFRSVRLVWGVRATNVDLHQYDWLARLAFRAECWFSCFADLIIVNSHAGRDYHVEHGFPDKKMVVVPNGIDTDRFKPDEKARTRVRKEWGIADNENLIGLVGRIDPMKDHRTFLQAASRLAGQAEDVRFVCVGGGQEPYKSQVYDFSRSLGLGDRLIWAGARNDMPAVYNAMDLVTSSSVFGEGMPNAIGEAMACGVPGVVTDVGDSARMVGDTGVVVPPGSPAEIVRGWQTMLEILKEHGGAVGEKARARIVAEFGLDLLVERTYAALKTLQITLLPCGKNKDSPCNYRS